MGIIQTLSSSYAPASGGVGYDVTDDDAQAFVDAAVISDSTTALAVDDLVIDLKAASLWTKMVALYPFVGGTATAHKFNLKDPRNLDAAFRIVWSGGVTHDANGITGNGSSGSGDTKLAPSTALVDGNDTHISVYCRTDSAGSSGREMGTFTSSSRTMGLGVRGLAGTASSEYYRSSVNLAFTNSNSQGHYISTRRGDSDAEMYKNGSSVATDATSAGTLPSSTLKILSFDAANYTSRNLALASIGYALSDAEAAAFYTCVQDFQTALSRNV
jgi:hypothetical protein